MNSSLMRRQFASQVIEVKFQEIIRGGASESPGLEEAAPTGANAADVALTSGRRQHGGP
jgi:hypothetical protein